MAHAKVKANYKYIDNGATAAVSEMIFEPSKTKVHINCTPNRFIVSTESCDYYYKTKRYGGCKNCVVGETKDYSKVEIDIQQHLKDNPAMPGTPHSLTSFRFWNE